MALGIVSVGAFALEAADHLLRNANLAFRKRKRIPDDPEAGIHDQDPSVKNIRKRRKLRVQGGVIDDRVGQIASPGHLVA